MRILIVHPPLPAASGNRVTADRYGAGLQKLGHTVHLVTARPGEMEAMQSAIASLKPDCVHLLHAFTTGSPWLAARSPLPFVVTLTGTDIHAGISTPAEGPTIRKILSLAGAVITQNPLTAADLRRQFPQVADRLHYLPPGLLLGDAPYPLRQLHDIPSDLPLFLHPAGIRPVKGNLELLHLLDPLAKNHLFTAAFCGPILDEAYSREFFQALAIRPWTRYLGTIPPAAMAAALRAADVILNNSASEGMPNSLLEAAAVGRPILARNIPGNAAVVQHGMNGFLYRNLQEFLQHAVSLLDFRTRKRFSVQSNEFCPEREAALLEKIYLTLIGP